MIDQDTDDPPGLALYLAKEKETTYLITAVIPNAEQMYNILSNENCNDDFRLDVFRKFIVNENLSELQSGSLVAQLLN